MRRLTIAPSYFRRSSDDYNHKLENDNEEQKPNFNVLSFDGGGSKGIMEAVILQDLMNMTTALRDHPQKIFKIIENEHNNLLAKSDTRQKLAQLINEISNPIHPTEVFNMFAGSSTGALIAFTLVGGKEDPKTGKRMPMSVQEAINVYFELIPKVFHDFKGMRKVSNGLARKVIGTQIHPYDNLILLREIERYFGQSTLQDFDGINDCVVLATAKRMEHNSEEHYDAMEYFDSKSNMNIKVSDVLMATTNAPILFKTPWYIRGVPYVDGGVGANCPLSLAISRMKNLTKGRFQSALSIAPPRRDIKRNVQSTGLKFWLSYLMGQPMVGYQTYLDAKWQYPLGHFMRLTPKSQAFEELQTDDTRLKFMLDGMESEKIEDPQYLQDILISALPIAIRAVKNEIFEQLWDIAKLVINWTFQGKTVEKGLYIAKAFHNISTKNTELKCEFDYYFVSVYYELNMFTKASDEYAKIEIPLKWTTRQYLEPKLLTLQGKINYQLGKYYEAEHILMQAIAINDQFNLEESWETYLFLSKSQIILNQPALALNSAQIALELNENQETIFIKSKVLLSMKDSEEAIQVLQKVSVQDSNRTNAKKATLLGRCYLEQRKLKEAVNQHQIAVGYWDTAMEEELDPDMIEAYYFAGQAYMECLDPEKALLLFEQAFVTVRKMYKEAAYSSPYFDQINQDILKARNEIKRNSAVPRNQMTDVEKLQTNEVFVTYQQRWWILSTVILLNIANCAQLVAFPSVIRITTEHYGQSEQRMNYIPTLRTALGIPFCLVTMHVVQNHGLKIALKVGGNLTGIGGLICFVSTLPGFSDYMSDFSKYYLVIIGHALMGIATPFIACLSTKISQHWFGDNQRMLATTLLGMSSPLGIFLGQSLTPTFVLDTSDVPVMNGIWFIPCLTGFILAIMKVHSDLPPTPPSLSSASELKQKALGFLQFWPQMKLLFTNVSFIIIFLYTGGGLGFITVIFAKLEQILCSKGYTSQFAGLCGISVFLTGIIASFFFVVFSNKFKKHMLISKLVGGLLVITSMILINYFIQLENEELAIILSCVPLGISLIGLYPITLDLLVECTYPIDQVVSMAFLYLSSAVQGTVLMVIDNILVNLSPTSTPDDELMKSKAKYYGTYLDFITVYMVTLSVLFMIFFKTEMKRTNADKAANLNENVTDKPIEAWK